MPHAVPNTQSPGHCCGSGIFSLVPLVLWPGGISSSLPCTGGFCSPPRALTTSPSTLRVVGRGWAVLKVLGCSPGAHGRCGEDAGTELTVGGGEVGAAGAGPCHRASTALPGVVNKKCQKIHWAFRGFFFRHLVFLCLDPAPTRAGGVWVPAPGQGAEAWGLPPSCLSQCLCVGFPGWGSPFCPLSPSPGHWGCLWGQWPWPCFKRCQRRGGDAPRCLSLSFTGKGGGQREGGRSGT